MIRTLLLSLLLSSLMLASSNFTVKLAAYKNGASLDKMVNKLPPALRKTVRVEIKRKIHFAYSIPTPDRPTLEKLLPAYRKVFHDAYIAPTAHD